MTEPQAASPADWNQQVIAEFRANAGRVGGPFEGSPLILLTTTGARTGRPRTSPLGFLPDSDRLLVVASNAGADSHPAWYHNLMADPRATVETGAETYEAIAVPVRGGERDRLFARVAEAAPGYADYQKATARTIPVIALRRAAADPAEARARAAGDELRALHDWFRGELAALREEADAYLGAHAATGVTAGPGLELGRHLREHCLTFCTALDRHHTGEDGVAFPHLEERFPQLGQALRRLRQEHRVVERLREELQTLLTQLGPGRPAVADPLRLRAEIHRLASELEAHFDYEEDQLVPVLNALPAVPWPAPR
ncbi:nitroreductase/quinone reductase family protein [Streptosporangium carneum]|uniref:Cation-binding protein n=1 Tax=Streptosporangium carneum TaxID=47481 RepID=A0A9W6IA38_9ACTN|nr:nitroreductase/quinone reductase family protein [Streptosporangium carneum]GLK13958.1 cation-binding protein [Streptosporangium carneum]